MSDHKEWQRHLTASLDPDALEYLKALTDSLVDDDDCWFDHHGGCQAHGYLSLEAGEVCPQAELKDLVDRLKEETGE